MKFAVACLIASTSAIRWGINTSSNSNDEEHTGTCQRELSTPVTYQKTKTAGYTIRHNDGCWYNAVQVSSDAQLEKKDCPSDTNMKGLNHQHANGCWYHSAAQVEQRPDCPAGSYAAPEYSYTYLHEADGCFWNHL